MADITPARKLFDLLVSRDFDPEMLDSSGKPAADPAETEIYSFDFRAQSGKDYGTVVIMLGDDNDLEVYCSDNVGRGMEGDDKNDWFAFLEQLKNFAVRNFMSFGIKNLNRLRYSMQGQAAIKEGLFESWTGNRTTSWNGAATEARLMIRHKKNIAEGDARYRYIESLFIETADSERYKLPFKSLTGGRAMLEHVRQGGRPYDTRGNHISEIVTELAVLSRFRRANQGQIFEGDTQQLVEQVKEYQSNLQRSLKGLGTRTGYTTYFESWSPAEISEQDVVIESLKNLFVKQSIDTRIESALPLLAKIQQQGTEMKEANIFEAWVERLAEGTWALPDTPEKQDQLIELLSTDLPVGADATNATEQLYDLVGDDELFDQLGELADRDANADARQVVMDRLQELSDFPEVRRVLDQLQIDDTAEMNPPEATNPADLEPSDDEENIDIDINKHGIDPEGDYENIAEDALRSIRRAAGLTENVLTDSTGSTLQHILDTFKRDVRDFQETGEVSDELHNALYDYYFDDMPYGTKKARDGDPYEWVADRFGADLGIDGYGSNSPGIPDSDYSMERESVGDYADEYQDSLAGMLKIAGVPAQERPAPQYDHAGGEKVDEIIDYDTLNQLASHPMAGTLAAAGGAALGGVIGKGIEKAANWYHDKQEKKAWDNPNFPKTNEGETVYADGLNRDDSYSHMGPERALDFTQADTSSGVLANIHMMYKMAQNGMGVSHYIQSLQKLEPSVVNGGDPRVQKPYKFIMDKARAGELKDPKMVMQVMDQASKMMGYDNIAQDTRESKHDDPNFPDKTTDEAIDPTNPKDYEIPTVQRRAQGLAPLTTQDIEQKDRKAEFDYYQRAHGKPHPDSATEESRSPLAGQYGHAGKMKEVSKDTSFLDRLKELSGMKK